MDKKTKIYILVVALVLIVCAGAWFFFQHSAGGTIAVIWLDGAEYDRIDLSRVKQSYDIEFDTQYGHNTVHVEPGAISVSEADCPDQICVRQGTLHEGGMPLVCMPHRLVVSIEGSGIDG